MSDDRRPLTSRDTGWARRVSRWLARTPVTPNQISMASMAFAALGALAFWLCAGSEGIERVLLLLAGAACCQARLLCNLFDGMVAVEGGKASATGPFWNEFPDRIADTFLFVGAGLGAANPALGWAAAALSILTAYVRELGRANGLSSDYSGPMAKQHRMAVLTGAALLSTFEPSSNFVAGIVLEAALWIVIVGAAATVVRRAAALLKALRHRPH